MVSGRQIRELQRQAILAASLGSLKILQSLLRSHVRASRNELRKSGKSRKLETEDDYELDSREDRKRRKHSRKIERREKRRGASRRGSKRKWNDVEDGCISGDKETDFVAGEEYTRHMKRPKMEEERETHRHWRRSGRERKDAPYQYLSGDEDEDVETGQDDRKLPRKEERKERHTNRKGRQREGKVEEGSSSQDGQPTTHDLSSSYSSSSFDRSPEKPSRHKSFMESGEEEVNKRRKTRQHCDPRQAERNIVNCRDTEGLSLLHHACHAGSEKVVKYLISKGAGVHARDCNGNTPLHIAAKLGPPSVVSILRNSDADMEAVNDGGVTPSDILGKKQAASSRTKMEEDQQKWYCHMAEELSENEDPWWGMEWGEQSEQPDWEDPILERMAESRQTKCLFTETFSLRDFIKIERSNSQGEQERQQKRKARQRHRAAKNEEIQSPVVIGPKVKLPLETQSYSQRWKKFSESCNLCVSYSSVPFPVEEGKEETLREVLLRGINPTMHRDALRKEILKWHPDKFLQKWGAKLQGPDHDRIVARVNEISQALHQLYKDLTPAN